MLTGSVVLAVMAQILMNRSMLRDPLDTRVRDVLARVGIADEERALVSQHLSQILSEQQSRRSGAAY